MPSSNQILTQNDHSRSFKVIRFGDNEEPLRGYMVQYNNFGLECEGSEDTASERSENRHLRRPHSHLTPSLANPREYPHKSYIARNKDLWATFLSLIARVYLHANFSGWLRNTCVKLQRSAQLPSADSI